MGIVEIKLLRLFMLDIIKVGNQGTSIQNFFEHKPLQFHVKYLACPLAELFGKYVAGHLEESVSPSFGYDFEHDSIENTKSAVLLS